MKGVYVVNSNYDGEIVAVFLNRAKAIQCALDVILDIAKNSNWTDEEISEYTDEFFHEDYNSDIVSIVGTVLEE